MKVEIWSDVVCPWCYLGKRRFEAALGQFAHRDAVEIVWRSFQLDPAAPRTSSDTMSEVLARKYGMSTAQATAANARMEALAAEVGLEYHLSTARPANTLDAHRLIHLARHHGRQDAMTERLMRAYFTDNVPLGDRETLVQLSAEAGLDPAEARAVLEGDAYTRDVEDDVQRATALGIRGVPFFLADESYAVSGAQPGAILLEMLERAWADSPLSTAIGRQDEANLAT